MRLLLSTLHVVATTIAIAATPYLGNRNAQPFVKNLSEAERNVWHKKILIDVFKMANVRKSDHARAFNDTVKKFARSRVLDATNWSEWGGYRAARDKLREMYMLAMDQEKLIILPAPILIAIVVLRQYRGVQTTGKDDASVIFKNLHQMSFVSFAIENYTRGIKFTTTDIQWHLDPTALRPKMAQPKARVEDSSEDAFANGFTTRKKALEDVGHLIYQTMAPQNDPRADDHLEFSLNEHIISVLPAEYKQILHAWTQHTKKQWIIKCIYQATEDKVEDTWTVDSIPSLPANPESITSHLQDSLESQIKEAMRQAYGNPQYLLQLEKIADAADILNTHIRHEN
jgi:hypothetical protein